jgi:hypothetical protein
MKRKQGYYWIKYRDTWAVGYYFHNCPAFLKEECIDKYWEWQSPLWHDEDVSEDELQEINETRIPSPDEKCIEIPNDNTSRTIPINMERPIEKSFIDMMENNHNQ